MSAPTTLLPFQPATMSSAQLAAVSCLASYSGRAHALYAFQLRGWFTWCQRNGRCCTNTLFARYSVVMSEITVSDARARLADVVDAARVQHDPVYLTRRGQRVAAVIDADDLDGLIAAAEDLADLEAARAAREEMAGGQDAIPWEQVKADLGLA